MSTGSTSRQTNYFSFVQFFRFCSFFSERMFDNQQNVRHTKWWDCVPWPSTWFDSKISLASITEKNVFVDIVVTANRAKTMTIIRRQKCNWIFVSRFCMFFFFSLIDSHSKMNWRKTSSWSTRSAWSRDKSRVAEKCTKWWKKKIETKKQEKLKRWWMHNWMTANQTSLTFENFMLTAAKKSCLFLSLSFALGHWLAFVRRWQKKKKKCKTKNRIERKSCLAGIRSARNIRLLFDRCTLYTVIKLAFVSRNQLLFITKVHSKHKHTSNA